MNLQRLMEISAILKVSVGSLLEGNTIINAIGFNMGELSEEYRIGDKIDISGVLEINTFNGVDSMQINIKDIMRAI